MAGAILVMKAKARATQAGVWLDKPGDPGPESVAPILQRDQQGADQAQGRKPRRTRDGCGSRGGNVCPEEGALSRVEG